MNKNKVRNKLKATKGITLIALVITIIVLLILAAVSIATLTGENGILSKANTAKTETEKAGAKEKVQMAVMSSFDDSGKLDYTQLKTNLDKVEGIDKNTVPSPNITKLPITVTVDDYEVTINGDGSVTVGEGTGGDPTPNPPTSNLPSTEDTKPYLPDDNSEIISNNPRNLDKYDKVHIIGDIHGCYSTLTQYFEKNPINKNEAYIFVGDYFDRGIENYETFKLLNELSNNENMLFLVGNHEDKLYKYACDDEFKMDYDIKNTIKEFEDNNVKKSEIRGFIKKLSQIAYVKFGENAYLITHGGISYIPEQSLDFYSTNSFIYGIDKYDVDIDKLYNDFMKNEDNKIYQIHGHRNFYKIKYDEYKFSLNLDGDIEHGGHLRVLTLNKNGQFDYIEIENEIYNPNLIEETNVYNLIENLKKNKYVFEKDLGSDIYSFNFSKEAFYNRVWDNMTTQARGLFIDVKSNRIVARSYNKFFKINERKETELENIEKTLAFPVKFYLKYNGFLGILSVKDSELFFASKSTNTGDYVEYFKSLFYKMFNDKQIKAIKDKIIKDDVTIVFEVMDNIRIHCSDNEKIKGLIERNREEISENTLTVSVEFGNTAGYTADWDINGEKVSFGVERV